MSDVLTLADTWCVVINLEDQYSIWPFRKDIPYGWREEGTIGTKEDCLAHIKEIWVDMRPRSLKEAIAAQVQTGVAGA
ncbi:MAG TPA: MbtH family protein [Holosporales bacterium]|nr:MbtH family protein [Holosporales bacterium]